MSEKNLLSPAHTKQTQNASDGFTGDGLVTGGDAVSIAEVAPTLARNRKFVTVDVVKVTDFYTGIRVTKRGTDTVKLMDVAANLQKRGKIDAPSTGTKGQSTLTLTTGFGQGGFGQLGLGGSLTQNV